VIAAVHGLLCGAFYWINECDIVICAERCQFFDPHVTFGRCLHSSPSECAGEFRSVSASHRVARER